MRKRRGADFALCWVLVVAVLVLALPARLWDSAIGVLGLAFLGFIAVLGIIVDRRKKPPLPVIKD